jgi:hypothetical protein
MDFEEVEEEEEEVVINGIRRRMVGTDIGWLSVECMHR